MEKRRRVTPLLQDDLMSLTTGTKVGRYEIRSKIGEGGMVRCIWRKMRGSIEIASNRDQELGFSARHDDL